jgi:hypothetical protein
MCHIILIQIIQRSFPVNECQNMSTFTIQTEREDSGLMAVRGLRMITRSTSVAKVPREKGTAAKQRGSVARSGERRKSERGSGEQEMKTASVESYLLILSPGTKERGVL